MDKTTKSAIFRQGPSDRGHGRRTNRLFVDLSVTVSSDHNFLAGKITNLSVGGVFVATHIVHSIGTQLELSIHLGGDPHNVVRAIGKVRWYQAESVENHMPQGLGVEFVSVQGDGQERIDKFLATRKPKSQGPSDD